MSAEDQELECGLHANGDDASWVQVAPCLPPSAGQPHPSLFRAHAVCFSHPRRSSLLRETALPGPDAAAEDCLLLGSALRGPSAWGLSASPPRTRTGVRKSPEGRKLGPSVRWDAESRRWASPFDRELLTAGAPSVPPDWERSEGGKCYVGLGASWVWGRAPGPRPLPPSGPRIWLETRRRSGLAPWKAWREGEMLLL